MFRRCRGTSCDRPALQAAHAYQQRGTHTPYCLPQAAPVAVPILGEAVQPGSDLSNLLPLRIICGIKGPWNGLAGAFERAVLPSEARASAVQAAGANDL